MPTPLEAPFNVTTTVDNKKITVKWDDKNANGKVSKYDVSFLKKDTLDSFVPPGTLAPTTSPGDGVTHCSVDITRDGAAPLAADLGKSYIAKVVSKPSDAAQDSDSEPGLQISWEFNPSLTLMVGDKSFTLTKSSVAGDIYRLPVSRAKPFQITIGDLKALAVAAGLGEDSVPSKWPNGDPITGSLNLYKLVIDMKHKLMALDIAADLSFTPFPGLTVKEVGLVVLRTDGVHEL